MEELQLECNQILDDEQRLEEDKIELIEQLTDKYIENGAIKLNEDKDRLVLDILWRHRDKTVPIKQTEVKRVVAPAASVTGVFDIPPPSDPTKLTHKTPNKLPENRSKDSNSETFSLDVRYSSPSSFDDEENEAFQGQTMSPFDMLRNILGKENSDEDIEHALEKYGFDISNILKLLMPTTTVDISATDAANSTNVGSEQIDKMPSIQQNRGPSPTDKTVCKYFIQWGECLRSDCMYSHDLTSTICRFWLRGHCLAGDTCPFSHNINELIESQEDSNIMEKAKKTPSFTDDDFPTLGQNKKKHSSRTVTIKGESSKPPVKFEFKPSKKFIPSYLKVQDDDFTPVVRGSDTKTSSLKQQILEKKLSQLKLKPLKRSALKIMEPRLVPWVREEYGINKDYVEHRIAAFRFGEMRNKYLQLAADSWHKNNGGQARALSKKGQMYNNSMLEEYTKGRELLLDQAKEEESESYIDLHGMELNESIDMLKNVLNQTENEDEIPRRPVYAVCSSGHYFKRERSSEDQLSRKVKEFLDNKGYEWKEFCIGQAKFGKLIGVDPWSHI